MMKVQEMKQHVITEIEKLQLNNDEVMNVLDKYYEVYYLRSVYCKPVLEKDILYFSHRVYRTLQVKNGVAMIRLSGITSLLKRLDELKNEINLLRNKCKPI